MKRTLFLVVCLLLSACGTTPAPVPSLAPTQSPNSTYQSPDQAQDKSPVPASPTPTPQRTSTPKGVISIKLLPSATPIPDKGASNPGEWQSLPVIPENIDPSLQKVYEAGLKLGNDPHAFSILGDCQTRPDEFFGAFERDMSLFESLPPELQETVENFRGSFTRESSTSQDGTTPGALLWTQWHRGEFGCTFAETPVECELRTHRPSFVIIQVGTHFESRNMEYLRRIILQLIDAGVVPILATKADNRELDHRINRDMALLASEYDLPFWNFWAAVSDLPNRGLYTRNDRPLQGDIYLTEEAALRHRMTGLKALNAVWRAVAGK
jgi:hypothetical protein